MVQSETRSRLGSRFVLAALVALLAIVVVATVVLTAAPTVRPLAPPAAAADGGGTRLLRMPTASATHIAFVYASNIWVVERAGGRARRLTSFQGTSVEPAVLARREVDCVQRRLRGKPGRLPRAGRRGRTDGD